MIINQAPVTVHNTSWTGLRRAVTCEWNSFQRSFRSTQQNARLFRKLRAAWLWHHRAFADLRIDGQAMPGENFVHLWRTGDTAGAPSKDRSGRIPRVRERSRGRLIDNVSEGTFYRALSIQDISPLRRKRFQPQVLWQIWNRCWQVHDGES